MTDEIKKYGEDAYAMVKHVANDIGPRLPGSEQEEKLHEYMSDNLKAIGLQPVREKFVFAPHSSIGGLPYVGWGGIIATVMLVVSMLLVELSGFASLVFHFLTLMYVIGLWVWQIVSVFKYNTCFDWCFKHKMSRNTYAQLLPEDGEFDYTIYLSAHTDTSWTLKLSASQGRGGFKSVIARMAISAPCIGLISLLTIMTFVLSCIFLSSGVTQADMFNALVIYNVMRYIVCFGSPFFAAGCFLLTMYNEKTAQIASPGAMDNATGVALAYQITKYFAENPDKLPKGCRIIDMNCGAEEAGLRGSIAFTRRHKGEPLLENAYQINIDSIADRDYFTVIDGDAWLCPHFDEELAIALIDSMKEAGIDNPKRMANPVGGCDSTPFQKSGVRSITVAAQKPEMTPYYHTFNDVPERFDADTVALGMDVVLRLIDKIALKEQQKKGEQT